MRNPYEVLELPSNATPGEIRTAFRRLAAQHHPDRHQNSPAAQARFTEINSAFQVLSDPKKRAAYDRFGSAAFRGAQSPFEGVGFESVVADLIKAVRASRTDGTISQELELSFVEAAEGCEKKLHYERIDHCGVCAGSGTAPGSSSRRCTTCAGRGKVRSTQGGFLAMLSERTCSKCRGTGRIPETACPACQGRGLDRHQHSISVQIPAGADHGSTRSIPKAGHRFIPNGKQGRLEVRLRVARHPFFKRSGDDIVCQVPISFVQATLGGHVEIPTLRGKIKLTVPAGTQPGTTLRVRGRGLPHRLRGGHGDQLVEVVVEIPTQLDARARELLEKLGEHLDRAVQPQQRSFVDKLKELFG